MARLRCWSGQPARYPRSPRPRSRRRRTPQPIPPPVPVPDRGAGALVRHPGHRAPPTGTRSVGSGGAVIEGFRRARGAWVVVMDVDLQHPSELIAELVHAGIRDGADLVVASRYAAGGRRGGLDGRYRRLVSRGSTLLVKLLFNTHLTQVSDPLSGFFAVRRTSVELDELRPEGYKILLEVRARPGRGVEVPFTFAARLAGDSKASLAEGLRFLRHLARLCVGENQLRLFVFALIGLSGLVPNAVALWQLTETAGLHSAPAAIMATQVAVAWNSARPAVRRPADDRRRQHHWPAPDQQPEPGSARLIHAVRGLADRCSVRCLVGARVVSEPATAPARPDAAETAGLGRGGGRQRGGTGD